ncbi:branched-chain amino acid ABC transporter permease [Thalassobaculum fulvum]|jgi:branched-chain amino acid transport system permease protein|uniref:Branched-chain amino acid ABC transporter permease n=1 Tax=Thalassobaculum fulvum TaxID=1633335 RepID=A0A919CPX5_9PROT|nr:branched-chain amino acid ABC transporter permease [Thalassobaculum fulvum]GHD51342.1 branched-chain amino acid ABC transporter permease [Thalassobaculum fulvum]
MTADASFWIVQTLNALQLSMLLFLLSVGLTVIFGLLHFVNLAHGSLYALGAFVGVSASAFAGSYWAAFAVAPVAVALVGIVLYVALIRRMRNAGPMNQVLVTFGLIFVFLDLFRLGWGDIPLGMAEPDLFSGRTEFLGIVYPTYRLFIIGLGLVVLAALSLLLSRTQLGAIVRAGVDNGDMAACLGINVERVFFVVFCLGCALAGLAGAVAAPVLSVTTDMGTAILIPTLVVVVIGGLGSLRGAIAGSLLIGFVQTFGAVLAPQAAAVAVYALLAVVLILRPAGLFPARG